MMASREAIFCCCRAGKAVMAEHCSSYFPIQCRPDPERLAAARLEGALRAEAECARQRVDSSLHLQLLLRKHAYCVSAAHPSTAAIVTVERALARARRRRRALP